MKTIVASLLAIASVFSHYVLAEEDVAARGFPRLGMWWPDPEVQNTSDIARYDFITLHDYWAGYLEELNDLNPQQIVLNSTNACELSYTDSNIGDIPAEWFLTQVGSTLSADIDATTTQIRVEEVLVFDGGSPVSLFEPGDTVLLEGESLRVLDVNPAGKVLTVERGHIRPASAHAAGTRIAAHISFWPSSWLLNLSTLSPTAVQNPAVGAERWGDYNARFGAALVSANPAWDGLLIDRADPDQSWLVDGSYARTIDPDQSNRLIRDYSGFNTAWNDGLRQYQNKIRQLLEPDKILFTNWGIDNYDVVNGNNFEGFPLEDGTSYQGSWHDTVFGDIPNKGSYAQWMEKGIQPNLTMIETYEDDGFPENGDLTRDGLCARPGFTPNYRKMRFGLTTALLNDGYFSWEMNTNGHGALCLNWFDEYDNAGQGRGYLGQPLGSAYQPAGLSFGPDELTGGTFENQAELDLWSFWADSDSGYAASVSLDTGSIPSGSASARVDITRASGTNWKIALSYNPLGLEPNKEYTVSFRAKADRQRPISVWAQESESPWSDFLANRENTVETRWQNYEYSVVTDSGNAQGEFKIGFGQLTGTVWIDDVRIRKGGSDIWRRDFNGGSVVVNATQSGTTIDLGQALRKIRGVQAPTTNDGSLVTQVTVPSLDGVILLSEPAGQCDEAMQLAIPSDQWHLISLPCSLPAGAQTVRAVLGDDLNGTYGVDWVVYAFDPVANAYADTGLNGMLTQSSGYWVMHANGTAAILDLPVGSTQTETVPSSHCVSAVSCYSIAVTAKATSVQWNMLGYPYAENSAVNRWRIKADSGVCGSGCTLGDAKGSEIVDNTLWYFAGETYQRLQGNVSPWYGFWIAAYAGADALNPALELPVR